MKIRVANNKGKNRIWKDNKRNWLFPHLNVSCRGFSHFSLPNSIPSKSKLQDSSMIHSVRSLCEILAMGISS
jgi:hypothetical protein